ncbi:hypothetical protein [Cellulomonas sp. Marseille-Q8402]
MRSASLKRWLLFAVIGAVAVSVHGAVTDPENRVFAVLALPLLALFMLVVTWRSTWVDPVAGTVTWVRWRCYRRSASLGPETSVDLVMTGVGTLLVRVRYPGSRRRLYVLVLSLTQYVERSREPELLRLLADTLERCGTGGGEVLVPVLRAQAEHVEAGGDVRSSPLAAFPMIGGAA